MSRGGHKAGRNREEYLNAFPQLRRFLNECVVCHETGYNPEEIKKKQGKFFQARFREYFHPLELNESGVCPECERRLASTENES